MIELTQHIEVLLLENDCVTVLSSGGFVAHYASAIRVVEENTFSPPTHTIGFDPQLKMNGGPLAQSYMAVYDTSFSNATKIVDKTVKELLPLLHEDEKVDLPNMSESRYSIHDTYDFVPYNNKVTIPHLYGLDCFGMQRLTVSHKPYDNKVVPFALAVWREKKRVYRIGINPSHLTNAAVVIAIVVPLFFFSIPIENTEVVETNYVRLLPDDLFEQIGRRSLAITPTIVRRQPGVKKARASQVNLSQTTNKKTVALVAVREVKVRQRPAAIPASYPETETAPTVSALQSANMLYHIIVANIDTEKDVDAMAQRLVAKGHAGARMIIGDGKMRVNIQSCATEKGAYRALNQVCLGEAYQSVRVLKK